MTHNALSRPAALLLAASTLTLAFAGSLNAETESNPTANSEPVELTDFIVRDSYLYSDQVSALKTPTPILDVPQSVTITDAARIREQAFNSISDIVDYTPGINNAQGEAHRDAVVFRGSRSTGSFFVDGVRDDVEHYRPLYNVEQLEVLRGPNALLFGRGGTGGVINRVMKKGMLGQDFTDYEVAVDTFGAHSAQIDSNFALSEEAALRLNTYYEGLENHRDHYDGTRIGINPTLHYQLAEKTRLDLSYEYIDNERFIDRGIPTGDNNRPIKALDGLFFGDRDQNETTFEAHVLRAAVQHWFSNELKGRFDLAYGDYDKYYENFYASAYDPATREVTLNGYKDSTQRQNLTISGGLIGEFETGTMDHTLVAGFEYIDSDNNNDRREFDYKPEEKDTQGEPIALANLKTFRNRIFNTFVDDNEATLGVLSLYVQDEIALSEHFDLILGARYDRFDFEVDIYNAAGAISDTRSQLDEEITPRLGFVFKPQENISLYASYSQTFMPKSGEQFASVSTDERNLDPDEFVNLEAGIKWDLSQSMAFTAAVFNLEQDATEGDGSGNYGSVESEVTGFEAQFVGQLTEAWFLSAGYSFLDGEVRNAANNGNRPRELPEHSFSVWNRYQLTEKFGLGLGAVYQDETFVRENNVVVLPDFIRIDAAAYYAISETLRLQLNIENLLDETYFPHAHADHQASVGAPIHARIAISGRF